jgi:ribonuclease VapC
LNDEIMDISRRAATLAIEIERDPTRLISAGSMLEAAMVVESKLDGDGGWELDLMVMRAASRSRRSTCVLPAMLSAPLVGETHPAGLNFGDCFAYALSKASGGPLLFKGGDFTETDAVPAPMPRSLPPP